MDMIERIDARGQACPLPVIRAKKALAAMDEGSLEVLVDDETAVHNLEALAKTLKFTAARQSRGDGDFSVTIVKGSHSSEIGEGTDVAQNRTSAAPDTDEGVVVVISAQTMGQGDDTLGATLMKGFLFALSQQDALPSTVLFYNGGVHLTCVGSEVLDDLRTLADAGVAIMSCGACLAHYELTDKVAVGDVTNMYVIVEKQMNARVIIRP